MMKNDFEFLTDQIENSGVKAPEKMDESYVLDRISGVQPREAQPELKVLEPKKPKSRYGRLTAIAAVFVAAAVLTTALTVHFTSKKPVAIPEVSPQTGLIRFTSYDEVHSALEKINADRDSRYLWMNGGMKYTGIDEAEAEAPVSDSKTTTAPDGVGSDSKNRSHSETYKQVAGVDEPDIIKTDGRYIYVVDCNYEEYDGSSRISIFPATPGVSDPILILYPGQSIAKALDATPDEATPDETPDDDSDEDGETFTCINTMELYLCDDRLIAVTRVNSYQKTFRPYGGYPYYYYGNSTGMTRAYVYDISDMAHVELLDTFTQSGSYTSSRMIGDTLYLISNEYTDDSIPCCGRGDEPDMIPADCIYSIVDPNRSTFLIVSAYDTADYTSATDSKAILGAGDEIYCNENNLYITAANWSGYRVLYGVDYEAVAYEVNDADDADDPVDPAPIDFIADDDEDNDDGDDADDDFAVTTTRIYKVSLNDGIAFTAYGEVEGTINNQYSLDEYNGYLRIATTSYNRNYQDVNNLFVLDGSLNKVGAVTGFAETESIKAVKFVGNTAYVITYVQTDPLFVIDLSVPTAPAILGEVKITGFSTMLVPIDANTLLGIGVNTADADYTDLEVTNGVKLALFDVSDKTNPKVLDSREYPYYYSSVTYYPRALVYNPDRGDFVITLNYSYYGNYTSVNKGCVLNFRVEDGRIVETDRYTSTAAGWIERCVYVGDTIYMTYIDDYGSVHLDSVSYR